MRFFAVSAAVMLLAGGNIFAGSNISELEAKLEETRSSIKKARDQASATDAEMFKFKDRVVYSNASVKAVYMQVKALEKELLEQRDLLENEMMKLPEYREILKKRNDAYKGVREFVDEEKFILTQLKSLRAQSGEKEDGKE